MATVTKHRSGGSSRRRRQRGRGECGTDSNTGGGGGGGVSNSATLRVAPSYGQSVIDPQLQRNPRGCGKGSQSWTKSDFWPHSENPVLADTYSALFQASTLENYGLFRNQTAGTEGWSNILAKLITTTAPLIRLNGTRGYEEARSSSVPSGFFCSLSQFYKITAEVIPTQQKATWAASDREGYPYLRWDMLTFLYGISRLASKDLVHYYMGVPYTGMDGCKWAALPDVAYPTGVDPNASVAQILSNALSEIALERYDVDLRNLVGITGLGAFTGVTLPLKKAIVAPFPEEQVGSRHPWLCFIWFLMQQFTIAYLNSRVCAQNYRFDTAFLIGAGFWHLLRQFGEIYHCLNIPTFPQPIDIPTLTSAMTRIVSYACAVIQENNRGGFQFKSCDLVLGPTPLPTGECDALCSVVGPSVNSSVASGLGNSNPCECPRCCEPQCDNPCPPPPCPPPCEACPIAFAPYCFPKIGELVGFFIDYAYVVGNQGNLLLPRGLSSSSSSSSGLGDGDLALDEEKGERARAVGTGSSGGGSGSGSGGGGGSSGNVTGFARSLARKWARTVEGVFDNVRRTQSTLLLNPTLANLYLELGEAVYPTTLIHNNFEINPGAFLQSLTSMFELILRETLGQSPTSIRLNHSPGTLSRTAFTALSGAFAGPKMTSLFISCTNDLQTGARYDYCSLLETIWRVQEVDFQAYYRGKRLEGYPPCVWARLDRCAWSISPELTLGEMLSHSSMGIFLMAYAQDARSFLGIPGLPEYINSTMTLREVLSSENPLSEPFLDYIWFIIQEALAGYLNGTMGCIHYRLPPVGGFPFFILRSFSDALWALNSTPGPTTHPINTPTAVTSIARLNTFVGSVAHENRRGVDDKDGFFARMMLRQCTRQSGCSCKSDCIAMPDPLTITLNMTNYLMGQDSAPPLA